MAKSRVPQSNDPEKPTGRTPRLSVDSPLHLTPGLLAVPGHFPTSDRTSPSVRSTHPELQSASADCSAGRCPESP